MTKGWGPLGWATLHSIAALYPDSPSENEKQLLSHWMVSFNETILCPSCLKHFHEMLVEYTYKYPNWMSSRRTVVEFVFRAHNTVNLRLNKKVYTFDEAIAELRTFLPEDQATARRREYLVYIRGDWIRNMTLSGISVVPKLKELNNVESDYWGMRSLSWSDLLQFSDINMMPLHNRTSTISSNPIIPKMSSTYSKPFRLVSKLPKYTGQSPDSTSLPPPDTTPPPRPLPVVVEQTQSIPIINAPKVRMPVGGFSLKNIGKIGPLSSLR